jgi:hypothetical protein
MDSRILTKRSAEQIISIMTSRRVICLLLPIFVLLASLCLVPFGHGPASVVIGPSTAFRAYRASVQVRTALSATLAALAIANIFVFSRPFIFDWHADLRLASDDPSLITSTLRC